MGISHTVSDIDGDFSRKMQNFPTPVYFTPADGVTLVIGYQCKGSKTRMMGRPDVQKRFKIGLAV